MLCFLQYSIKFSGNDGRILYVSFKDKTLPDRVQRVVLKAKPAKGHKTYNEWETATLCFLVSEHYMEEALCHVKNKLANEKWELLYYELRDTLIHERVVEVGGDFFNMYKSALKDGLCLEVFPDNYNPGKVEKPYLCPPTINERYIDNVVFDCGGRRLTDEEKAYDKNKNADFIIDDFIFELKELQEEGLDKLERRQKISNLFSPYYSDSEAIYIDPSILSEFDRKKYYSILSSPIEKKAKEAFKQVKDTRDRLSDKYKLGLIYLNSGYLSLPFDIFDSEVRRYVKKSNLRFDEVITLSVSGQTNGFDLYVNFYFDPKEPVYSETKKLQKSWWKNTNNIMTTLVRGELGDYSAPQKPISFHDSGIDFYWLPYAIERFTFGIKS